MWHCSFIVIESLFHTGVGVFDAKPADHCIDQSDDEDNAEDDVVQDVGAALALQVVDVQPTDD